MRLIDADALEEILEKVPAADIRNMGGQAYVLVKLSQVFNAVDNQPTIEERKTGHWLRSGDDLFPLECDQCSETNERKTPWCPHCGAKMEVEHE